MTKMTLPMASMPAAISESVASVLAVHGLSLSPDLLREIGRNATQALFALDSSVMANVDEPTLGLRLSVGETLRALGHSGRPNPETAEAFTIVGKWLAAVARAELDVPRPLRTDSVGRCALCGYEGPGPRHDCGAAKPRGRAA